MTRWPVAGSTQSDGGSSAAVAQTPAVPSKTASSVFMAVLLRGAGRRFRPAGAFARDARQVSALAKRRQRILGHAARAPPGAHRGKHVGEKRPSKRFFRVDERRLVL